MKKQIAKQKTVVPVQKKTPVAAKAMPFVLCAGLCAAYMLLSLLLNYGFRWYFGALFSKWNLNAYTVLSAPIWAAWLFENCAAVISVVVNLLLIAVLTAVKGRFAPHSAQRSGMKRAAIWGGVGFAMPCAAICLFLAFDCMRVEKIAAPMVILGQIALYLPAVLAEEMLIRRIVFAHLKEKCAPAAAYGFSLAAFFIVGMHWQTNLSGMINTLLLGALLLRLYEKHGTWTSFAFRLMWCVCTFALFAYPGAYGGMIRLYHVSEAWITGGEEGFICAAAAGAMLVFALAYAAQFFPKFIRRFVRKAGE